MKRILLLLSIFATSSAWAQISNFGFGGVKIPQFMASTVNSNNALPVVFRARIAGLKPNQSYKYFTRAINYGDFGSTAAVPGAGISLFLDSGNWKASSSPGFGSASGHDTFWTNGAGEYEGWFGFVGTSDSRFKAGKNVYPCIIVAGLSGMVGDSLRTYGMDSIHVAGFGAGKSIDSCTGIWGKSLATNKSFVAIYDNVNGMGRPISMTMVEKDEITVTSAVGYYSSNVEAKDGYWGCVMPNDNANGIQRIEKLDRYNGLISYANTDADSKWGGSNKNTINPTGGKSSPIALDENDAALVSPMIEFWARTSTTNEGAGTKEVYVVRKYSNSNAQSVRLSLVGGTATKGTDFNLTEPRTITFQPGGQANDTTKITLTDDNIAEGDETIVVRLDNAVNCVIGTEVAHTITVNDNDIATLSMAKTLITVKETAGTASIKVKLDKAVSTPSSIRMFVKKQGDSTKIPNEFSLGASYKDSVFSIGKSNGPDSITIKAKIFDDLIFDQTDSIWLCIRQKSGIAKTGTDSIALLLSLDNDGPAHVRFIQNSLTVGEGSGSVKVKIKIVSRTDASADFTLRSLPTLSTATQGTTAPPADFTFPSSQLISIDTTSKDTISISVPLLDDQIWEPTEVITFNLGFLNNIVIDKPDTMRVYLLNDDLPLYSIGTITKQTKTGKVADSLNVHCRVAGVVHGVNMITSPGVQFTLMNNTGGIGVLSPTKAFGYTVKEGDSVLVQGKVDQVLGMVVMDALDTIIRVAQNKTLRTPNVAGNVDETTESRMTKFNRVILANSTDWPATALTANTVRLVKVKHTDGTMDSILIDAETNIDGTTAPGGYFNVTGIGGQIDAGSPYNDNYVLVPRYLNDFETSTLPTVNFKVTTDTVFELATSATMTFNVVPLDENFSFDLVVSGGNCTTPQDYTFAKKTINVLKNNSVNPVNITLTDDVLPDGNKTLKISIRNIQGPGAIGKDSVYSLYIKDDEANRVQTFAAGNIKLYPNPASGVAYVSSNQNITALQLIAADGRTVYTDGASKAYSIPLENLSAGVYMVKLTGSDGVIYSAPLMVK